MKNLLPFLILLLFCGHGQAQFYALDNTFNTVGYSSTGNHANQYQVNLVNKTVIQPDGKILMGGVTYDNGNPTAHNYIVFTRFNQDGSLDNSFGNDGVALVDPTSARGQAVLDFVVLPDGKILGIAFSVLTFDINKICLFRLNSTGSLDNSYCGNGKCFITVDNLSSDPAAMKIVNGRIYIASRGILTTGPNYCDSYISRYDLNGNIDLSYGTNGFVKLDYNNKNNGVYKMAFQNDGKIVLMGVINQDTIIGKLDYWLTRVNVDGTLDTGFGNNGNVVLDIDDTYDYPASLYIADDKKIYVGGSFKIGLSGCHYVAVARYNDNGQLDNMFANSGVFYSMAYQNFTAEDIVIRNGKILVVGGVLKEIDNMLDFGILHLNYDGSLNDENFDQGLFNSDFQQISNNAKQIFILPDGKIIIAGVFYSENLGYEFGVARYITGHLTDINEEITSSLQIYPNPATDNIIVKSTKQLTAASLYNSAGQLVFNQIINSQNFELNSASYPRGIYLLKIDFENGTQNTQKLVFE